MASSTIKSKHLCRTFNFARSRISLALLAALSTTTLPAYTQEAEQANDDELVETIEVRGIRASMAENLAIKRMSNAIVDAITAEDIGKFPDKNVADSLQRVPGIVITRSGGEGSQVSIRGLSEGLTFTQLNGNYIASSPGAPSRSFNFALLPSTMVERVEVFKSSEARLDEGGVGGSIIVHSRKPFNLDANSGSVNVEYTYADVTEDYEPSFSGVYSWKNDDEDIGFLVGYTRQERTNRSLTGDAADGGGIRFATDADSDPDLGVAPAFDVNGNIIPDSTRRFGALKDANGNVYDGVWLPQVVGAQVFKEERIREGTQATIQYAPLDDLTFTFNYFHFSLSQDHTNSRFSMPEWKNSPDFVNNVMTDDSGTIVTGIDYTTGASGTEGNLEFPWISGGYVREKDTSDTFDLEMEYVADDYSLRVNVGHTKAEGGPSESWNAAYKSGEPASRSENGMLRNAANYAGWRLDNQVSLYADPLLLENLQAGIGGDPDPGSTYSSFAISDIEEDYAQIDVDYSVNWGPISQIRVGAKYRESELHREVNNTFFLTPEGVELIASGQLDPKDGPMEDYMYQWIGGMPNFADVLNDQGEQNITGGFNINVMPTINWDKYRDIVTDNYQEYTRRQLELAYDISEEIQAAYLQADYEYGDMRGNIGVRYVETTTTVASTDRIVLLLDDIDDEVYAQTQDVNVSTTSGDQRALDFETLIERDVVNKQWLPSFNFAWDISDNLILRASAAKTMSRPGLGDLGGQESLTYVSEEYAEDRATIRFNPVDVGWSGSGGNKALEPYESIQTDLSLEYYYGEGSGMGIALFNKEVDNFIVPLIITSVRPTEGYTNPSTGDTIVPAGNITVSPFNSVANGSDATSRGIELYVQHNFESGYGFNANYTINDTNQADVSIDGTKVGESALIGSADNQFNLSAYYENDLFSVRASYNRRGKRSLSLHDGLTVYGLPYEQIDVNASYNITESLIFSASVINLTKEESFSQYGDDTDARLRSSNYTGRRIYAGVTYRF
ncbi:TonB-dependent receptor [Aestuariibacter sp. AA17]|uniref:TonB-dependent receptor n=1 Tax=Fluctibacter corallii TaxID=2984329 RepID=A0ABT3AA19_9ALTE|nr:TonB-dependent receptor [Aestuariibacter sp. AA17]MCV2885518.1 TonB-dependent receptor [Aestuariibacter sp. AA17]